MNNRSMLKEVKITNFRNIVSETMVFEDGKGLVITGKNELGKTNRLSAILWALGSVMFDGGSRDSMSNLVPFGANSDTVVSVSITFSDGNNITKYYNEPYELNDDGIKVPKVTKTWFTVNGGKPLGTVKQGKDFIINQLGLNQLDYKFSSNKLLKSINLIHLLTTTIGIRLLDNATLRELLIDIVGDVDPHKLAKEKPQEYSKELVKLLEDVNGDINKVRDDLRYTLMDKTVGLETKIEIAKNVLNDLELEANKQLDENALNNAKSEVAKIDKQIKDIELKKHIDSETLTNKIDLEIAKLQNERQTIVAKITDEYNKAMEKFNNNEQLAYVKKLQSQEQDQINVVRSKEIDKNQAQNNLTNIEYKLQNNKQRLTQIEVIAKQLKVDYDKVIKENGSGVAKNGVIFTCPHCNNAFDVSETKEHLELHKKEHDKKVAEIKNKVVGLKKEKDDLEIVVTDLELDVAKARENLTKAMNELNNAIKVRDNLTVEVGKALDLCNKTDQIQPTLSFNTEDTRSIDLKIETLKNERNTVLNERESVNAGYDNEIEALEEQKLAYQETLDSESVRNATLKSLEPKRLEYNDLIKRYEDTRGLYAMSKKLLVDTFKELERRIEVKFGNDIWFKLYEPNATDGGDTYKTSVCEMYVKDSSGRLVPAIANGVSTSMQEVRLVEFVERLKAHYELPNSIIFIDRLESLDDDKLKMLSKNNQIITAVVTRNQPTIKYESI